MPALKPVARSALPTLLLVAESIQAIVHGATLQTYVANADPSAPPLQVTLLTTVATTVSAPILPIFTKKVSIQPLASVTVTELDPEHRLEPFAVADPLDQAKV